MLDKKVYAIVTKGSLTYAAHIEEWRTKHGFDSVKIVCKKEYRKARADGMPSLGEVETKRKLEESSWNRKSKKRAIRTA